jgi:hypothetical protein
MRVATSLLFLILAGLCCVACDGSHRSFSVQEVERTFAQHGLPFASEITPAAKPNPYLKPSQPPIFGGLPKAKEGELDRHVRAVLAATNPRTYSNRVAYVFDSAASLTHARQLMPGTFNDRKGRRTVHGNETSESGCAMHRENVFVQASYDECARVRSILTGLR